MKKDTRRTAAQSSSSRAVVTATVLALPLAALPSVLRAQTTLEPTKITVEPVLMAPLLYEKYPVQSTLVGYDGGHSIYRNSAGEYFYLDAATGDIRLLTARESLNVVRLKSSVCCKLSETVTILGVDASGNTLQKNVRGETFYLSTKGDMIFLK